MSTTNRAVRWHKSSFSGGGDSGNCLEIAFESGEVYIRDSKYVGSAELRPVITVTAAEWSTFLAAALDGRASVPETTHAANGYVTLAHNGIELTYTPAEWSAFTAGVRNGELAYEAIAA